MMEIFAPEGWKLFAREEGWTFKEKGSKRRVWLSSKIFDVFADEGEGCIECTFVRRKETSEIIAYWYEGYDDYMDLECLFWDKPYKGDIGPRMLVNE